MPMDFKSQLDPISGEKCHSEQLIKKLISIGENRLLALKEDLEKLLTTSRFKHRRETHTHLVDMEVITLRSIFLMDIM